MLADPYDSDKWSFVACYKAQFADPMYYMLICQCQSKFPSIDNKHNDVTLYFRDLESVKLLCTSNWEFTKLFSLQSRIS